MIPLPEGKSSACTLITLMPSAQNTLIGADDSLLAVIDVQDYFLARLPTHESQTLVARIVWLMNIAGACTSPWWSPQKT